MRAPIGARFLTAAEAAERLGVKRATLYSYVARGHLSGIGASRAGGHLYSEDDVERLRSRAAAHKGHAGAASGALRFGEPVLSSSITRIDPRGPAYRGVLATRLVDEGRPFEAAVELLVGGSARPVGRPPRALAAALGRARAAARGPSTLAVFGVLATHAASVEDPATLLAWTAAFAGPQPTTNEPRCVADALRESFRLPARGAVVQALDAALVLLADHELNASAFACRVAASTGAPAKIAVLAGLAALAGHRHGEACLEAHAMLRAATRPLALLRARGPSVPGFGHPLYPDGDPRATRLLAVVATLAPRSNLHGRLRALEVAANSLGLRPNVDLALAALTLVLRAPPAMGPTLFAVGRMAGLFAHALEQRAQGVLLRPRARYVGP
jgi:citrate synthase